MEGLDPQTIIAVIALMTGLGFIFNLLLKPVKDNQGRFEKSLGNLEARQARFEKRLDSLENKLDQLLARN